MAVQTVLALLLLFVMIIQLLFFIRAIPIGINIVMLVTFILVISHWILSGPLGFGCR